MKRLSLLLILLLTSCGDFPDYGYDQSEEYCVMKFPFAAGIFGRKYIGYLNITSTLQYLDADPEINIFIGEPSHIDLDVGSVLKVVLDDQVFEPEYHKSYMQPELQYWGPAFTFSQQQSSEIYQLFKQGFGPTIYGRFEVGSLYEANIYNFFFDSDDEPFRNCVNRLLDEEDLVLIASRKKNPVDLKKADDTIKENELSDDNTLPETDLEPTDN